MKGIVSDLNRRIRRIPLPVDSSFLVPGSVILESAANSDGLWRDMVW